MKKKVIAALCALLLIAMLGAAIPSAAAAEDDQIFFTAVNETVLALNDATMPFFSGGSLYVPYTIFDSSVTGENMNLFLSYSKAKGALIFYNLSGSLFFDLNQNTSIQNGTTLSYSAIIRNSTIFVPINVVCTCFGLDWSWIFAEQGSVIRLKSSSSSLSDRDFATAAAYTLNERLRVYLQSKEAVEPSPSPSVSPTVTPTPTPPTADGPDVRFAFRTTENSTGFQSILDVLSRSSAYALFLFRPDELLARDDDVRLLLARGHKVGLLLDAETAEAQFSQLTRGRRLLSLISHTHTAMCMSVGLSDEELQDLGPSVLFWESTVDVSPEDGRTATAQVLQVVESITDDEDCFILLNDSAQAALVLTRVMDSLTQKGCSFLPVTEFSLIG